MGERYGIKINRSMPIRGPFWGRLVGRGIRADALFFQCVRAAPLERAEFAAARRAFYNWRLFAGGGFLRDELANSGGRALRTASDAISDIRISDPHHYRRHRAPEALGVWDRQ